MTDQEKIDLLREALKNSSCTYHMLYKVPISECGYQTKEMHHKWCMRCKALDLTSTIPVNPNEIVHGEVVMVRLVP